MHYRQATFRDIIAAMDENTGQTSSQSNGTATLLRLKSSKSNEWYTPPEHIALVKSVFGGTIDLDPASCTDANDFFVAAKDIFTEADGDKSWKLDGHSWYGNVYLNPPYGGLAGKFSARALHEFRSGNIRSCILNLSGYAYETNWFRPLLKDVSIPICWVYNRVKFVSPDGKQRPSTVGTMYVYLGPDKELFTTTFSKIGAVR